MVDVKRLGMVFDNASAYLKYIALPGFEEFVELHKGVGEHPPAQYIRRFVVAAESMNNVLDYFYWEQEPAGSRTRLNKFRERAGRAVSALATLSSIANAYKHAVRTDADATIKQATNLIKHPRVAELMGLDDKPREIRRLAGRLVDSALVTELEAGGAWWQAFADDPMGTQYQLLVTAMPPRNS